MQGHSNGVRSLSFSPDGSILASGSADGTNKLWSMPGGQLITTLTVSHGGDQSGVRACVYGCVCVCVYV